MTFGRLPEIRVKNFQIDTLNSINHCKRACWCKTCWMVWQQIWSHSHWFLKTPNGKKAKVNMIGVIRLILLKLYFVFWLYIDLTKLILLLISCNGLKDDLVKKKAEGGQNYRSLVKSEGWRENSLNNENHTVAYFIPVPCRYFNYSFVRDSKHKSLV